MDQKACIFTLELWITPQTLKISVTSNIKDHTELLLKSHFPVISLWRKKNAIGIFRFLWLNILIDHKCATK